MAAISIAVVNDDTAFLQLMEDLLGDEGYTVQRFYESTTAYDGVRAMAPDAIILDIRMEHPDTGWQLLEMFTLDPALTAKPVIVCSADTRALQERAAYLQTKGCEILPKPFDLDDLLVLLGRLVGRPD